MDKKGLFVIISSPSGGGKDAVINALVAGMQNAKRLVTTTSRAPRPGNQDGVDYHFISETEFKDRLERGAFIEYNIYAGNYYGTEKSELEKCLNNFEVVLSQADINGKHALDRLQFPHLSIFLVPENLEVLRARIQKRGGIDPEAIEKRLQIAQKEIIESADYDYRIINTEGQLQETIQKVKTIILEHALSNIIK